MRYGTESKGSKKMILNNIHENEFIAIGESIGKIIKDGTDDSKKVIFICGKDKNDISSYRYKISTILSHEKIINSHTPKIFLKIYWKDKLITVSLNLRSS
nr:hypothetical protein KXZ65_21170 [Pectobacterium sp. PL152]